MKTNTNKTTSTVRVYPFAFWGFWVVIAILIFSAIAFLGASFPQFPWLIVVTAASALAFLTAIWLWGFYVGFCRKTPVTRRTVEDTITTPNTDTNMEEASEKGNMFVQDPDWEDVPSSEEA